MKCKNCGAELKEDSRFCGKCGTPVPSDTKTVASEGLQQKPDLVRKSKNSKWILIGLAVLLLLGGIGGGSMIVNASRKSEYQETISMANRYYNQQDFERAEEMYLHSIDILPKEKEPYIQLVQIYTVTGQPEKIQAIAAIAQEKLPVQEAEEVKKIADEAVKELEQKLAELQRPVYRAYADVLQRMLDGYDPYLNILPVGNDVSKPVRQYCLKDIDGDGIDELFVHYDGSGTAPSDADFITYQTFSKYDFDMVFPVSYIYTSNTLSLTPMTNGFLREVERNDETGYKVSNSLEIQYIDKYDPVTDRYQGFARVDELDQNVMEENYDLNKSFLDQNPEQVDGIELIFPGEFDDDNDGLLYKIEFYDTGETLFVDKDEVEDTIAARTNNAENIDLVYEDVNSEVILKLKGLVASNAFESSTGELVSNPDYSIFPAAYANYDSRNSDGTVDPEEIFFELKKDGNFRILYQITAANGGAARETRTEKTSTVEDLRKIGDFYYTVRFDNVFFTSGNPDIVSDKYPGLSTLGSHVPQSTTHIFLKGYPTKNLNKDFLTAIDNVYADADISQMSELPETVIYLEMADLILTEYDGNLPPSTSWNE